jgi:hypothetical protein
MSNKNNNTRSSSSSTNLIAVPPPVDDVGTEDTQIQNQGDELDNNIVENRKKLVNSFKSSTNTALGSDIDLICLNYLFEGISKDITNLFCGISQRPADFVAICLEGSLVKDLSTGNVLAVIYGNCWTEKEVVAVYIVTKVFEDFYLIELAEAMLDQIDTNTLTNFPACGMLSKTKSAPNIVIIVCNETGWFTCFSKLFPESISFTPGKSFNLLKKSTEKPMFSNDLSSFPQSSLFMNLKSSEKLAQLRPLQNILNHDQRALSQIIDTHAYNLDSPSVLQFLRRVIDPYMMKNLNAFSVPFNCNALLKFQFFPSANLDKNKNDFSFETKEFKSNYTQLLNFHSNAKISSMDDLNSATMNLVKFLTIISNTAESIPKNRWRTNFDGILHEISRQDNLSMRFVAEKGAIEIVVNHMDMALSKLSLVLCHQETSSLSLDEMDVNIKNALTIDLNQLRQDYLDRILARIDGANSTSHQTKRYNQSATNQLNSKDNTMHNKARRIGSSPKGADVPRVQSSKSSMSSFDSLPTGKRHGFCIDQMLFKLDVVTKPCSKSYDCLYDHNLFEDITAFDPHKLTAQQKSLFLKAASKMRQSQTKVSVLQKLK